MPVTLSQTISKPFRKQPVPMPKGYWMDMPLQLSGQPDVLLDSAVTLEAAIAAAAASSRNGSKINLVGIIVLLFFTENISGPNEYF
jgi:hypothetical protein